MSTATLLIGTAGGRSTHAQVPMGESLVGRSSAASIRITHDTVSSEHAVVRWDGRRLMIRDNGSTNGTRLHGSPIGDWTEVRDGDAVQIGGVQMRIRVEGVAAIDSGLDTQELVTDSGSHPISRTKPPERRSIFISYAREDARMAEWLSRWLTSSGWDVWVDSEDIRGGARWAGEIEGAIGSSSVLVLLLSSNSVLSDWVGSEVAAAKDLRVPVLVADLDDPRLPRSMQFLLRDRQRVPIMMESGRISQQSLASLDDALIGALEEAHGSNPDSLKLGAGKVLLTIGLLGFVVAFATFFYLAFVLSSGDFGAAFDAIPSDSPILGGLTPPQGFFAVFGLAFASMIVIGVGQALRRSARLKGVTWDMRRR